MSIPSLNLGHTYPYWGHDLQPNGPVHILLWFSPPNILVGDIQCDLVRFLVWVGLVPGDSTQRGQ